MSYAFSENINEDNKVEILIMFENYTEGILHKRFVSMKIMGTNLFIKNLSDVINENLSDRFGYDSVVKIKNFKK